MHAMSYLQKRAHLSAVALGRKMFAEVPYMTPARFDILHLLYEDMRAFRDCALDPMLPQTVLTRRLGLSRQTVFKMIERLVELGLVHKVRCVGNRGRVLLRLTREGVDRIEQAYGVAFTERYPTPPQADGSPAPRHLQRLAREEALVGKLYAEAFARLKLPPDPSNIWWGRLPTPPKQVGREVGRVFTTLAWRRAGGPNRERRLAALNEMLRDVHTAAKALGDRSDLIYPVPRGLAGDTGTWTTARRPRRLRPSTYPLERDDIDDH